MTIVEDQPDVIAFLKAELSRDGDVRTIATHASLLFLTRDRVYKLKRTVRFAFLDFSTAQKRLECCRAEVALNRRTAPALYRGVRIVTREPDGRLALDGAGVPVDALVEMNRFRDEDLLDDMARRDAITIPMATRLARRIAAFHREAAICPTHGGAAAMRHVLGMNADALRASIFAPEAVADLVASLEDILARHASLLDRRREAGKVRRCHGDLTLRNICLLDGEPTPFDCLEFNESLASIDVLYDLAFLVMDLWHRDRRDLANVVFNRYFDDADETDGLPLLPFFMAVRACIRAHVTATQAGEAPSGRADALSEEAHAYFDLARTYLLRRPPLLVAVGGLSGSGKSTMAAGVAPALGVPPGARILASDRIRKALHGVTAETRLTQEAYRPAVSARVYALICEHARDTLATGHAVVADAVFDRPEDRLAIETVARDRDVRFAGFWLEAPLDMRVTRVSRRVNDPSDATPDVVHAQAAHDTGPVSWPRIDARSGFERTRDEILVMLN